MWGGEYDKRPHVLATRYAALAASLLLLNANYQVPFDLASWLSVRVSKPPQLAC